VLFKAPEGAARLIAAFGSGYREFRANVDIDGSGYR
jgi:predicted secreted protein